MNHQSLRIRLNVQIALFVLSFIGFGFLAFNTLSVLRVNGPIYKDDNVVVKYLNSVLEQLILTHRRHICSFLYMLAMITSTF